MEKLTSNQKIIAENEGKKIVSLDLQDPDAHRRSYKFIWDDPLNKFASSNGLRDTIINYFHPMLLKNNTEKIFRCECVVGNNGEYSFQLLNSEGALIDETKRRFNRSSINNFGFWAVRISTENELDKYSDAFESKPPRVMVKQDKFAIFDMEF